MFIEKPHQHWKNRQDAHYATARPATLANGDKGVSLRIGRVFAVLSADEFQTIAEQVNEALKETETTK